MVKVITHSPLQQKTSACPGACFRFWRMIMPTVQPIKDKNVLNHYLSYIKEYPRCGLKYYALAKLLMHAALRIDDALNLKVKDVRNKNKLRIVEKKTGKERYIEMHVNLKEALILYLSDAKLADHDFLFPSSSKKKNKAICRQTAWQFFKRRAEEVGIEHLGTHTFRKSFGYHYYKSTKDIVTLQKLFKHSDASITLHYVGWIQKNIDDALTSIDL